MAPQQLGRGDHRSRTAAERPPAPGPGPSTRIEVQEFHRGGMPFLWANVYTCVCTLNWTTNLSKSSTVAPGLANEARTSKQRCARPSTTNDVGTMWNRPSAPSPIRGTPGTTTRPHGCAHNVKPTAGAPDSGPPTPRLDRAHRRASRAPGRRPGRRLATPGNSAVGVRHLGRGDLAWAPPRRGKPCGEAFSRPSIGPLGVPEGRLAGTWRRDFAAAGTTLHQADCLIAAAAVGISASLATANGQDFPMSEVRVEAW